MYVAGAWFASVMQDEYPDINDLWDAAPLPEKALRHDHRRRRADHARAGTEPRRGLEVDRVPLGAAEHGALGFGVPDNAGSVLPPRVAAGAPERLRSQPGPRGLRPADGVRSPAALRTRATARSRSPSTMLWGGPSTARSTPPRPWMRPRSKAKPFSAGNGVMGDRVMGHGRGYDDATHHSVTHRRHHGVGGAQYERPPSAASPHHPSPLAAVLHQMRKQWSAYLFLAPTMILFGIFTVAASSTPSTSASMSGTSWSRPTVRRPGQLQRLLGDERFGGAIVNTLYYTAASVP